MAIDNQFILNTFLIQFLLLYFKNYGLINLSTNPFSCTDVPQTFNTETININVILFVNIFLEFYKTSAQLV